MAPITQCVCLAAPGHSVPPRLQYCGHPGVSDSCLVRCISCSPHISFQLCPTLLHTHTYSHNKMLFCQLPVSIVCVVAITAQSLLISDLTVTPFTVSQLSPFSATPSSYPSHSPLSSPFLLPCPGWSPY